MRSAGCSCVQACSILPPLDAFLIAKTAIYGLETWMLRHGVEVKKESSEKEEKKDEKKEALAAQAVKEILKAIEQPDVQKHGTFILPDWHTTYKDQLGSYKKFVKRSTQLQVIEMEEGKYIIQKAGDTTAAAVPQAKAKAAKGDWKQLLASAWNIYCQATARHEWNIDVFTSALARGVRTTKPVTGDSAPASPKVGPKDGPDEPKDDAKAEAPAPKKSLKKKGLKDKADAEGPKKTLRKKGLKSKVGNEKVPDGATTKPKKKVKKIVAK
ncbi:unnamed protein product [Symbiodinium sp. CCMP2592]|nr:unnamed protein product [Symbiodinium sp. CCMP2592]